MQNRSIFGYWGAIPLCNYKNGCIQSFLYPLRHRPHDYLKSLSNQVNQIETGTRRSQLCPQLPSVWPARHPRGAAEPFPTVCWRHLALLSRSLQSAGVLLGPGSCIFIPWHGWLKGVAKLTLQISMSGFIKKVNAWLLLTHDEGLHLIQTTFFSLYLLSLWWAAVYPQSIPPFLSLCFHFHCLLIFPYLAGCHCIAMTRVLSVLGDELR